MARPKKTSDEKPIAPATHTQLPLQQVAQQFPPQQQQQPQISSISGMNGSPAGAPMAMAPQAPVFSNNQGRVIDVDNFMRVRDSVRIRSVSLSLPSPSVPRLPISPMVFARRTQHLSQPLRRRVAAAAAATAMQRHNSTCHPTMDRRSIPSRRILPSHLPPHLCVTLAQSPCIAIIT